MIYRYGGMCGDRVILWSRTPFQIIVKISLVSISRMTVFCKYNCNSRIMCLCRILLKHNAITRLDNLIYFRIEFVYWNDPYNPYSIYRHEDVQKVDQYTRSKWLNQGIKHNKIRSIWKHYQPVFQWSPLPLQCDGIIVTSIRQFH